MWLRLIFEYLARALPVAVPLLLPKHYPPVSWASNLLVYLGFQKPPDDQLGAAVALFGLILVFIFDFFNLYLPMQKTRQFGDAFFERIVQDFEQNNAPRFGTDLRLNVMFLRKPRLLGRFHPFPLRWVANRGFNPAFGAARDLHIPLWGFQGVCGRTLRKRLPQFADFRMHQLDDSCSSAFFPLRANYRLFRWQIRRTEHVKAILAVPICLPDGGPPNPRLKIIGVMNLDAISDAGAEWIVRTREQSVKYLTDNGQFLTLLA